VSELVDRLVMTCRSWYYLGYGKGKSAKRKLERKKEERQLEKEMKEDDRT